MTKPALLVFFLLLAACSFGPGNLQSRHSTDLEARKIRRIAVIPPATPAAAQARTPFSAPAPAETKVTEREALELLARLAYSALRSYSNWQIVSESEVREVGENMPPGDDGARLRRIGELVYADAVISGSILRFRERVGDPWGAKSPASVAFTLDLIDVRRGDIVWSARFDETQKSLSENLFALGDISQRGVRWLSAEQLTQEGVRKAVEQLHQLIAR